MIMRKIIVFVLCITTVAALFTGCIDKQLVEDLENDIEDMQDELNDIENENESLTEEIAELNKRADGEKEKIQKWDILQTERSDGEGLDTLDITFPELYAQMAYFNKVNDMSEYDSPLVYFDGDTVYYDFDISNNSDPECDGYLIEVLTDRESGMVTEIRVFMFKDVSSRTEGDSYDLYYYHITLNVVCSYLMAKQSPFEVGDEIINQAFTMVDDWLTYMYLYGDYNIDIYKAFSEDEYEVRIITPMES